MRPSSITHSILVRLYQRNGHRADAADAVDQLYVHHGLERPSGSSEREGRGNRGGSGKNGKRNDRKGNGRGGGGKGSFAEGKGEDNHRRWQDGGHKGEQNHRQVPRQAGMLHH